MLDEDDRGALIHLVPVDGDPDDPEFDDDEGPDGASCATCMWFYVKGLECRRHAPPALTVPLDSRAAYLSVWPSVDADDWCGEYEPVDE